MLDKVVIIIIIIIIIVVINIIIIISDALQNHQPAERGLKYLQCEHHTFHSKLKPNSTPNGLQLVNVDHNPKLWFQL